DPDMEAIEQLLGTWIALEIDVRVRMPVAREELLDTEGARGMSGADEDDVTDSARDDLHAPQDERPHQDLAQLAVGLHERQQLLATHLDHRARLAHADADEPAAARQHVDLAR